MINYSLILPWGGGRGGPGGSLDPSSLSSLGVFCSGLVDGWWMLLLVLS